MVYSQSGKLGRKIVAQPNHSSNWRANKIMLLAISVPSLLIALGFAAMGAWPILPFAGLELLCLGSALYYVCWKLQYRHVITLHDDSLHIQKGHYHPREEWRLSRKQAAISVTPENHPWDGPQLTLYTGAEEIPIGEFLNREDSLKLLKLLKQQEIRVGNYSGAGARSF